MHDDFMSTIANAWNGCLNWLDVHPFAQALLIMYFVPAVVSYMSKPRTPEDEAKLNPYVAAFFRVWRKNFADPRGVIETITRVVTRGKGPPSPPSPPWLPVVGVLLVFVFATSCRGAEYPSPAVRAGARGAVIGMAHGVVDSAKLCTSVTRRDAYAGIQSHDTAKMQRAITFGDRCMNALLPAHDGVVAAAEGIDAWNDATDEKQQRSATTKLGCAAKAVLLALPKVVDLLRGTEVAIPPSIVDAIELAKWAEPMASSLCRPDSPTTSVRVIDAPIPLDQAEYFR
jgi:hypothetical protein